MRNLTMLFTISILSVVCHAQPVFTKGDSSIFTDICFNAVVQPELVTSLVHQAEIQNKESIVCNGRSFRKFVHSYKSMTQGQKTFIAGSDTPTTALCMAATISNKAFRSAVDEHQIKRRQLKNLYCNDLPVNRFAKHHGGFKLSI